MIYLPDIFRIKWLRMRITAVLDGRMDAIIDLRVDRVNYNINPKTVYWEEWHV